MNIPDRILKPEERIMFGLRALYGSYGYTPYKMRKARQMRGSIAK